MAERGYKNIEELAQLLDVSTQTVRRISENSVSRA
ncbi:MAG: DeoR family transcriptional regulator [Escherichia coli]